MAEKLIKETPQYKPFEGPGVTAPSVRSRGIEKISVPTARPVSVPNMQGNQEGFRALQQGLNDLLKGITPFAIAQRDTLERGRKAAVIAYTVEMEKRLNDEQDALKALRGSDTIGMRTKFEDRYEEIKNELIDPEKWDEVSAAELDEKFTGLFAQKVLWAHGRELDQAEKMEEDTKILVRNEGLEETLQVPMGDTGKGLEAVEMIATEVLNKWDDIEGGMPKERYDRLHKAVTEDYITARFDKELIYNPSRARKLWLNRPEYFQDKMPNQWNRMNAKVESMKKEALIDDSIKYLEGKYGATNYLEMYKGTQDPEFIKKLDGDYSGKLVIQNNLITHYNAMEALKDEREKDIADNAIQVIREDKDNYIDMGNGEFKFNYGLALKALEVEVRKGTISAERGERIKNSWETTTWTTADDNRVIVDMAKVYGEGGTLSDADIAEMVWGDAQLSYFISRRDKLEAKRKEKALNVNYIDRAQIMFDKVAATFSPLKKIALMADREDYLQELRQYRIEHGLTEFDLELYDEAKIRLDRVVKLRSGEVVLEDSPKGGQWFPEEKGLRFQVETPEDVEKRLRGLRSPGVNKELLDPKVVSFINEELNGNFSPNIVQDAIQYLKDNSDWESEQ